MGAADLDPQERQGYSQDRREGSEPRFDARRAVPMQGLDDRHRSEIDGGIGCREVMRDRESSQQQCDQPDAGRPP